jgi:ferric-dicitrate binding protein FerR (iron transport regulator)
VERHRAHLTTSTPADQAPVLVTFALMTEAAATPSGCLTDAQLSEVRAAAPGQAPAALARHLAACERCQARALFGGERAPGAKKPMPQPPSVRRAALYALLVLVAMAAFFWSLAKLTGDLQ